MVIPYFFESYGITQNYDILFDPMVRDNVFQNSVYFSNYWSFFAVAPLDFFTI